MAVGKAKRGAREKEARGRFLDGCPSEFDAVLTLVFLLHRRLIFFQIDATKFEEAPPYDEVARLLDVVLKREALKEVREERRSKAQNVTASELGWDWLEEETESATTSKDSEASDDRAASTGEKDTRLQSRSKSTATKNAP